MDLGNVEVDIFEPVETPNVRYFGVAEIFRGCLLANIIEMLSSERYYLVVIQLPQVQFRNREIEWMVSNEGMVSIEGEISRDAMNVGSHLVQKRKRGQVRRTQYWGMHFHLPGPVDGWTASHLFTSETVVEISVTKTRLVMPPALSPAPLAVAPPAEEDSHDGPGTSVDVGGQAAPDSPTLSEAMEMVSSWFA